MVMDQGTVGCGVIENTASGRTGVVTDIFENSIHLTEEDCVLTLGSEKIPNHPYTIRTYTLPENISIGNTFHITKRRLFVERCYYLDLRDIPIYTPCFKTKYIVPRETIVRELQACREGAVLTTGIEGFFPLLIGNGEIDQITQNVKPDIDKIGLSIKSSDWTEFANHSKNIVGVGIGLTPSGDDFLSGVFAALSFYNTTFAKGFTVDKLKSLAILISDRTSLFSATLIKAAAQGWVLDLISYWLVSLFQGDSKQVRELTGKILKIGHSSGADILLGLITALESIFSKEQ